MSTPMQRLIRHPLLSSKDKEMIDKYVLDEQQVLVLEGNIDFDADTEFEIEIYGLTRIEPSMIAWRIVSSSAFNSAGTTSSKSCRGAIPTPSFFRLPTITPPSKVSFIALSITSNTVESMRLTIEVR